MPREWCAAGAYDDAVSDSIKHALDQLSETFRVPLLLRALGGLSYKEIAAALNIPVGTVMSRLFRARVQLRTEVEPPRGWRREASPAVA